MRDRQRGQPVILPRAWTRAGVGFLIAAWLSAAVGLNFHRKIDHVTTAALVALVIVTVAALATWVICRAIVEGHRATRSEIRYVVTTAVGERVPVTVPRGQRITRTTTYIPDHDFDPRRAAVARDLLWDDTGDIRGLF